MADGSGSGRGGGGDGPTPQDYAAVGAFLCWAECDRPGMMYGARQVGEAVASFAKILGITPERLRLAMGVEPPANPPVKPM